MHIRPAEPRDIPQIVKLGRQLWELHITFDHNYYLLEENFDIQFEAWVKDQLFSAYQFLHVAEDIQIPTPINGQIQENVITGFVAGFLKPLFPWFKTKMVGHISYLIIDPKFRRQKIGKILTESADKWFKEKNVTYVELYVEEKNTVVQSAWNNYGFGPFKRFLRKTI